jgi:hypothetical protein
MAEFFRAMAVREYRKVFMTAGFAAISRNADRSPQEGKRRVHVVAGNTLQLRIAANRAMGMEGMPQRHQPRMKTRVAFHATPGIQAE